MTDAPAPYYSDDLVTLYHGDCIDVIATLPDESVDAVVTDPPYDLTAGKKGGTGAASVNLDSPYGRARIGTGNGSGGFMGKAWDSTGIAFDPTTWAAVLRVLKPGGHLLAFGGTRTYHRMACAIEDAGFEIRDTIAWLYGSGFPKSLDVSKALDKRAGHWRGRAGSVDSENAAMAGANYERTDKGEAVAAAAAAAGWGTALKPANEPIIVARKALVGSVADNWLAHGTGALNIDACRTGTDDALAGGGAPPMAFGGMNSRPFHDRRRGGEASADRRYTDEGGTDFAALPGPRGGDDRGRWPTNVVLGPDAAAELDAQTGTLTSGANPTRRGSDKFRDAYGDFRGQEECTPARGADSGGASRFFPTFRYEAKAPTDERPKVGAVAHPTVKPLDLMRWLVRLVTPPGGVVLEPFAGSGTTAEACIVEGFRCIAIEREADYLPLILARITKPIEPVLFGESA